MVSAIYNRIIFGPREAGYSAWRDQIDRNRNERLARENRINFREVLAEVQREKTNPNPPSEPFLRPSTEVLSPAERMPTFNREAVMLTSTAFGNAFRAKIALANQVNNSIYFGM